MGTLSKRRLEELGADIRDRVEGFGSHVGSKLDTKLAKMSDEIERTIERSGGKKGAIERLTAALPSPMWLALAGGVIAVSVGLKMTKRNHAALFAGMAAPTLLLFGLYNKLAKVLDRDRRASAA